MKYSFIIPVYNCKNYLGACVESVRAMDMDSYEILLIDDGSTDGSSAVCDGLAAAYPQIRVIHQPNGGASAARNRGIREASGAMLLFLDADDSVDSATLKQVLSDPRCCQADLIIYGLTFDYYHCGKCYRSDPALLAYDGIMEKQQWTASFGELYMHNSLSSLCTKIFKREIIMRHRLELDISMSIYEDFEFVLRYLRHCDKIWNVPKAIYHYRQAEDEGNAQRRLAGVHCLSEIVEAVGAAMQDLSGVAQAQKAGVLAQLFQMLAWEKIRGSKCGQIHDICEDYAAWYRNRKLLVEDNDLHRNLIAGNATALMLRSKKIALRHRIAVWVKAHHLYRRK